MVGGFAMKRSVILSSLTLLAIILAACAQNAASAPSPKATNVTHLSGVRALAVDPRDVHLLKAASEGLFQSLDGGKSWQAMTLPVDIADRGISQVAIRKDQPDT